MAWVLYSAKWEWQRDSDTVPTLNLSFWLLTLDLFEDVYYNRINMQEPVPKPDH